MKKIYSNPLMEINLTNGDVLLASSVQGGGNGDGYFDDDFPPIL